jgi:hypothetical protein
MVRDVWLNSDECNFGECSYFICQYYIQELSKLRFIKFIRIIIEPNPKPKWTYDVLGLKSKVCYVDVIYDKSNYDKLKTEKDKIIQLANLCHEGMINLSDNGSLCPERYDYTDIKTSMGMDGVCRPQPSPGHLRSACQFQAGYFMV